MSGPPDPAPLLREAARLEQLGRLADAAKIYENILARRPELPDCWYNLGLLQRRLRRFDAALASYAQALARGVRQPEEVHLNRAVILADHLRQDAAAERELRAALTLNPRYLPALRNLANLHEDLGRREEALAAYARILELDPGAFDSLARSAGLHRVERPDDPLIARLRATLADPAAEAADRASLGFALGAALDSCGDYPAAFAAYQAANRESRASAPTAPFYDRAAQERLTGDLIRAFPIRASRSAPEPPAPSPRPIFICGMFRSGSTLAEQLLARHPQVVAGGELDLLPELVRAELSPYPAAVAAQPEGRFVELGKRYLTSLARLFPNAAYVTDKRPDNFLLIGLIKRLIPDARIVCTTRDPLDNCLSIFFLHLDQSMAYALDLMDVGHYYREYRRLMAHWKRLYPEDLLELNYDALVADPRPAVERLLRFCGLPWDEACLTPAPREVAVKTASVWQVREPFYRRSSGRSQHYRGELAALAAYLAEP
ncbi:MAG TPA: sulfotransferase [Steroidobacteraceae bacterium]|nr:sulfotransferase [Steroidobacteraceae bacterium]